MENQKKILLLDDNKDLLLVVQIILKSQGYDTIVASSVEEAERKIRIHKPSLILMDVFIDEQDGRIFCNQLKHSSDTSDIGVIMMSGCDDETLHIKDEVDADDFLRKPFDFNELLGRVGRQYERYSLKTA
jgi:two-component system, OmpR family, response regulator VicR